MYKIKYLMRAKFVNEIKQNKERSGLGVLGVGKAGMYNYYKHIMKMDPDIISRCYNLKTYINAKILRSPSVYYEFDEDIFNEIGKAFNTSYEKIYVIDLANGSDYLQSEQYSELEGLMWNSPSYNLEFDQDTLNKNSMKADEIRPDTNYSYSFTFYPDLQAGILDYDNGRAEKTLAIFAKP